MKSAAQETRELSEGYGVRFPSNSALFHQLAEWVAFERRCCPFLALTLEWSGTATVWLKLTGSPRREGVLGGAARGTN
jgi:hypothetical protein